MTLHLQLALNPCVTRPGGPPVPLAVRDAALLAWLALEGPTPRARLAGLLWPDHDAAATRNSLRQRLFQLRRAVGVDLVTGSDTLALAEGIEHDLADADTLLAGQPDDIGGEFAIWLGQQRERLRDRVRHALVQLVEMAEQARDYADALTHAQELLALDPLSEDAHRRVIRLHYLGGDRAAALLAFDHCEQVLKDEVGTRPSPQTLALLQTLHESEPKAVVTTRTLPASMMRPPRLVGRDAELAALATAAEAGHVAWITGEAGLGKSRLLDEAFGHRTGWVRAAARPGDDTVPYGSLARLLRALRAADHPAGADAATGDASVVLLHDSPMSFNSDPAAQRAALGRRLVSLLAEAMGRGLQGLALDDLHFADAASVELVAMLCHADALASLRWAMASRPAEGTPGVRALADGLLEAQRLQPMPLAPLDRAGMVALVRSLGLSGGVHDTLAETLHRHSGGNPLFALETLRQAFTTGLLDDRAAGALLPRPASVALLIERRLSQLSPQALRLARCAALAGPDFTIALATEVMRVPALDLADAWSELERAQVLRDDAFAHDLIFEAALASVPAPIAQHLHGQIGDYLARHGGAPVRLARHADAARAWPQAVAAYREAAEQALRGASIDDAVALLADAARCAHAAGDAEARHAALMRSVDLLVHFEFGERAQQALSELDESSATPEQALKALLHRLDFHVQRRELPPMLELAPRALADARALGRLDLELQAARTAAAALREQRRCAEAVALLEPYDARFEEIASLQARFQYLSALALALDYAGRLRDALQVWDRILALPGIDEHAEMLWQPMSNRATTLAKMGRVHASVLACEQALRTATSAGHVPEARLSGERCGHAHRLRDIGQYQQAMAMLDAAMEPAAAPALRAMTEHVLAVLYQRLGQPERALPLLAKGCDGMPARFQLLRRMHRGDVMHDLGQDGLPLLREAVALVPDTDDFYHRLATLYASCQVPPDEGEALAASLAAWAAAQERMGLALAGHVRAAACALAQDAAPRALPHVQAALHLAREYQPYDFYLPELWLVAARVHDALGRPQEVRRHLDAGRAWVMAVHDAHVPPPFRASFLERNAVNRELLAWAARTDADMS